jgi:DNA-binding PadR family transcriptional regulator
MSRKRLGEFEQLVLLALLRLDSESYGALILTEIEERTGTTASSGALYVALRRLERRGLLTSRFADPTPERGGRAKRIFRIEPVAVELLQESRRLWAQMSDGLDDVLST